MQFKKKLAAEKRRERHFLTHEDKEKWIEHNVSRETAGARNRAEDAEAADQQDQDDKRKAENTRCTNREPEMTYQEMMVAIGDSLSDLSSSDDGKDGEDEHDEQGQLSEDDEPGWVMGTITKTVPQHMERFCQMQMKLDR